mmetsp:Transcript_20449/g.33881  ORF Transcript_20449/g.33881 Transcript_20449/m.33881 type:complete len:376 (-) Transcript_20449:116-1243(-)|eukprot:CAMPEP_0119005348 /NCGR_PEP_ID=MMETSP1176-20130426/1660_1 /TAXON_ID=265551 /ORGANISM="Synedropsis recta cf, Strain CCMP1620" /LENGTH=375 /DNA_ID=CAMNT_0006957137 /DNA_START=89 /DNA_END=1216 /DNA_ORIENTATION=+
MAVNDPNVGIAFALVIGAGLATALGASVVFFPRLVKLASRKVLASALGLSAGVMTYVSFVEIFAKSTLAFTDSGETPEHAYVWSTLCFFGGAAVMLIIDVFVKMLSGGGKDGHGHDHHHDHHLDEEEQQPVAVVEEELAGVCCLSCSPDPVGDLEILQHQADALIAAEEENLIAEDRRAKDHAVEVEVDDTAGAAPGVVPVEDKSIEDKDEEKEETEAEKEENKKLVKMGINTAIAIGLHNFPEGLATFVAALNDPRVGAVLAIAIGIHNIPEGLCVALPIYYATGNRMKAFGWALLSGASEPLAALLGWAVLANSFSDQMYAILFGLVAGMMVIISVRELLPTAHRYDPEDTVVTYSFIGGMVIMALSLVLFVI